MKLKKKEIETEETKKEKRTKEETKEAESIATTEEQNEEEVSLSYNGEVISIPSRFAQQPLRDLGIQGCNHLLHQLEKENKKTLSNLPKQLDGIHTKFHGVGPRAIEKFGEQIRDLAGVEIRDTNQFREGFERAT